MPKTLSQNTHVVIIVIFALLTLALYAKVIHGPFIYDDFSYIVRNESIQTLNPFVHFNSQHFQTRLIGLWSFSFNYFMHGFNVEGYHLLNILIHFFNACLVFFMILEVNRSVLCQKSRLSNSCDTIAFWCAIIFLVHPLQTQAVSFISQRFTSLATLFYLLGLLLRIKNLNSKKQNPLSNYLSLVSIVLSMLSKEIAFTLPFMLIFIEKYLYQRRLSHFLKAVLATTLIIPILYANQLSFIFASRNIGSDGEVLNSFNYFMTQISVLGKYIQLFFIPIDQQLLYHFPIFPTIEPLLLMGSILSILGLIILAWRMRRKNPLATFGIVWFFLTLSVESSIIPIRHVIFEHRMYLPLFGLILSFVSVSFSFDSHRRWQGFFFIIFAVTLSFFTFQRNILWSNPIKMWESNARLSLNNSLVLHNLGAAYYEAGDFSNAITTFSHVLKLDPLSYKTWHSRGSSLAKKLQWVHAYDDFHQAILINPKDYLVYFDLGLTCIKRELWAEAQLNFERAVDLNPNYREGLNSLGVLALHNENWAQALMYFDRALIVDPTYLPALQNRKEIMEFLREGGDGELDNVKIKFE